LGASSLKNCAKSKGDFQNLKSVEVFVPYFRPNLSFKVIISQLLRVFKREWQSLFYFHTNSWHFTFKIKTSIFQYFGLHTIFSHFISCPGMTTGDKKDLYRSCCCCLFYTLGDLNARRRPSPTPSNLFQQPQKESKNQFISAPPVTAWQLLNQLVQIGGETLKMWIQKKKGEGESCCIQYIIYVCTVWYSFRTVLELIYMY
jgi:hypothetical protein